MIDVNHPHDVVGRVYLVDDPVCTHPRRVEASQFAKQRLADPMRVLDQRSREEIEHSYDDLRRQTIQASPRRPGKDEIPPNWCHATVARIRWRNASISSLVTMSPAEMAALPSSR